MARISSTARQPASRAQKKENSQSHFNLFGAKAGFTNEPLWYKLTVIIIIVIVMLAAIWILREWALPVIGQQVMRSGIGQFINSIKGRAP